MIVLNEWPLSGARIATGVSNCGRKRNGRDGRSAAVRVCQAVFAGDACRQMEPRTVERSLASNGRYWAEISRLFLSKDCPSRTVGKHIFVDAPHRKLWRMAACAVSSVLHVRLTVRDTLSD